jgi:hypothetical protein
MNHFHLHIQLKLPYLMLLLCFLEIFDVLLLVMYHLLMLILTADDVDKIGDQHQELQNQNIIERKIRIKSNVRNRFKA